MASKCTDTYGEPIVMRVNNAIVTVYRPILTPEERAKRMKEIMDASVRLVMSGEKNKQAKDN